MINEEKGGVTTNMIQALNLHHSLNEARTEAWPFVAEEDFSVFRLCNVNIMMQINNKIHNKARTITPTVA